VINQTAYPHNDPGRWTTDNRS